MKNAVEMKNVSYSYQTMTNKKQVLDNIDFSLEYGKIALIAGGSGVGKSTLFYIMNGVIPNHYMGELEGEILVDGENIQGKSIGDISKKIGSIFQNAEEQIVQKYVKDEIAFGPENLGILESDIEKQVSFYSELFELNPTDVTTTLSGGQKQRLITASTFALDNDIIILDEPLANLDKKSAILLMNKLIELRDMGKAIAIIEHRLDMVMDYVDVVYHLCDCKLKKEISKKEFLESQINHLSDICPSYEKKDQLFEVKNLSHTYGENPVLSNLDFSILKGERVLILGDNGCGKSTLSKIIGRLIKQDSGEVLQYLDPKLGHKKGRKKWFEKVSYVFQNPNYQLFMPSVLDELLFSCHNKDYAEKMIELFELKPLLENHPHALSQGQKRKLSIATMMAVKPEVLILDEPTVGQDYDSLKKLINHINQIHMEENNTVITITHDIRCANALCDKVILMKDGKIVDIGGKELIQEYFNNYTDKN